MKLKSYVVVLLLLVCAVSVSAQSAANWTEFADGELGLKVSFPGAIARTTEMMETDSGKKFTVNYISKAGGAEFSVTATDMPEGKDVPAKALFDGGRDGLLSVGTDTKATLDKDIKVDGRAARDLMVASKDFVMRMRLFYVDGRLYQILVTIPPALSKDAKVTADTAKFIDSAKFTGTPAK